jgi:hypothetical protein
MIDSNEKAVFDLGTYTFEGTEYRLLYSWPMLYAKSTSGEDDLLAVSAENAAEFASAEVPPGPRPPLGEAYSRAVKQGYLRVKR